MKERPILFSGPMVRAILDGRKTQTRRVAKLDPRMMEGEEGDWCPYGKAGDRLWVRETWKENDPPSGYIYRATEAEYGYTYEKPWRPSIFMPRAASRITLEIVRVRVERVAHITPDDCRAEGLPPAPELLDESARVVFRDLWDSINAKRGYGWQVNPWVWVIEFKRTP